MQTVRHLDKMPTKRLREAFQGFDRMPEFPAWHLRGESDKEKTTARNK